MNATGRVETWLADPSSLGPIYPWVGGEVWMMLLCLAFCIAFMIWKFSTETAHYRERVASLSDRDELARALEGPPPCEPPSAAAD